MNEGIGTFALVTGTVIGTALDMCGAAVLVDL